MAASVVFLVTNDVPTVTGDHVLVFIRPVPASANYRYYAWRDLNPSQGATFPFSYGAGLSAAVLDPATGSVSADKAIAPGQRFSAVNPNGQSPYIDGININKIEPQQAAILNSCSTPPTSIVLNWYNLGSLVVSMGTTPPGSINVGKTTLYEADPALYFLAADPALTGPDYGLYVFDAATPYVVPEGTTTVQVRWYRDTPAGPDLFEFSPPSAQPVRLEIPDTESGAEAKNAGNARSPFAEKSMATLPANNQTSFSA